MKYLSYSVLSLAVFLLFAIQSEGQKTSLSDYNIYAGSTHAHSIFTNSHGAHWERDPGFDRYMYVDSQNVSHSQHKSLKPDWRSHQGLPSEHFAVAKSEGYDFYVMTDHSQEAGYHPTSIISAAWVATKQQAEEATDTSFVALVGYEHSENNGPGGTGHLNVINTSTYLNALKPEIDLSYLYNWLPSVEPNGEGDVVATFNHPGRQEYDDWARSSSEVINHITMLEVINSNSRIHYQGFVSALDHGWKVSPVSGNDNHGLRGISNNTSRTFVLGTNKAKAAILDAMKNRRTYASLEGNIRAKYSVNAEIMGSTLKISNEYEFKIIVNDPDTDDPKDRITKIDIVRDNGKVVREFTPVTPTHSLHWGPVIKDSSSSYFFIRIWNKGGGDAKNADSSKPVAWLAPVWTGQ